MSKLGCLCVAFLAFQPLALGQTPDVTFHHTALTPGASVSFTIILPQAPDKASTGVHLVLGTATGSTLLTLSGVPCPVPVAGQTSVAFSTQTTLRKMRGTFQVPNDPSLIGLELQAATVGVQGNTVTMALTPIGPIVEELIL